MGLDMYLEAEISVSGYSFQSELQQEAYRKLVEVAGLASVACHDSPHVSVAATAIYWRKANAIHAWMVEHVQAGEDDCGRYWVPTKKLEELRATCRKALAVADVAKGQPVHSGTTWTPGEPEPEQHFVEGRAVLNGAKLEDILPTQAGFFFGSTAYDEWYLRDLENTVVELDRVLSQSEGVTFYYSSSW